MAEITPSSIDILLMGRTGNGKSALGNSILRRRAFKTSHNAASETIEAQIDYSEFEGRILKVVDTPGLSDNRLDQVADEQQFVAAIKVAIASNPIGYHAVLYVIRFGVRFTKEEVEIVKKLKELLGDDFIANHCILVLTCGDSFQSDPDIKRKKITFDDWVCTQQERNFKDLVTECGSRILLFNNRTEDEVEKIQQIARLIQTVDALSSNGLRYTNPEFQEAANHQESLLKKNLTTPYLKQEYIQELGLIMYSLGRLNMADSDLDDLKRLDKRANDLYLKIKISDRGTGVLDKTLKIISDAMKVIRNLKAEWEQDKEETLKPRARWLLTANESDECKAKKLSDDKNDLIVRVKEQGFVQRRKKEIEEGQSFRLREQRHLSRKLDVQERRQHNPMLRKGAEVQAPRNQNFDNLKKDIANQFQEIEIRKQSEKDKEMGNVITEAKNRIDVLEDEYQQQKHEALNSPGMFSSMMNYLSKSSFFKFISSAFTKK